MAHSQYAAELMGSATLDPVGEFTAGAFASFELTYTAGKFGIDDTGSLKIVTRFASDMGKPQFSDPKGWNYTTAEASNGAVLRVEFDNKRNVRPWDKTLYIQVVRGFLKEGDTITIRFGDQREGAPGLRLQTFSEPTCEFKVLVDAFATYQYTELPVSPTVSIVAGPPVKFKAILPTLRKVGEPFRFGFKGEDKWGNPSHIVGKTFSIKSNAAVRNLPNSFELKQGDYVAVFDNLTVDQPCDLEIEVYDNDTLVCRATPCRISPEGVGANHFWADLHGQSEETIGTNSARELFEFARDRAFLDAMSHQGNDFQITQEFWKELNVLTNEFNVNGRFIVFPGYEWSGNTGLGGDRNVLYLEEDRPIYRSSHALVEDMTDLETDANSADELFVALADENAVVFAHVGGRYADITAGHDGHIERSIEIHSDWGTFEWLLEDALDQGYRVGILANSDGHKGRHGASYPGASLFGAYGGLSCLIADDLTRESLAKAMRKRRHYATTGCRAYLDVKAHFLDGAEVYEDDPNLGVTTSEKGTLAQMGDVVGYQGETVAFEFELWSDAPIEEIQVRNRMDVIHAIRPFSENELGSRIRIIWEGSEYRGRGRQTVWDGSATLEGNKFVSPKSVNFWNLDLPLKQVGADRLKWRSLTTGGFSGVDVTLESGTEGSLKIDTALVKADVPVKDIGLTPLVFEGGGIARKVSIYRLPDVNTCRHYRAKVEVPLRRDLDNAIYIRATTEDGCFVYSSPVYVINN